MKRAIEIKNVSFKYANTNKAVFKNANFHLEYGEIALLSGMSGDGKSTLFYLINGMIPNVLAGDMRGDVYVNGANIKGKTIGEISRLVGSVLQNAEEQIIKYFVKDEIAFGCENIAVPSCEIEQRVVHACEKMHLDKEWKTRTLSGGQKQRLITATTLAMGQKIIILDEPLANLDKENSIELMEILKSLANEGYAVMVIEHRIDSVMPYVDKVWEIKDGEVVEIIDKKEYLKHQSKKIPDTSKTTSLDKNLFEVCEIGLTIKKRKY
jgi:energy-coupling factor transporter ATP-binding protein EcfA2